ncbi:hypothetical protein LTR53_016380 [Teratosphaeriaceae sp. CCFEE 6253]|nr:hypothetical protein LTR53_016380 [Teratosphaeriaceae sp. CCFEE 6253]
MTRTNPAIWDLAGLATMLILTIVWLLIVCLQVQVGLGTAEPPGNVESFAKYEYSADLTYLLAITLWKCFNGLSSAQIFGLADETKRRQYIITTGVIVLGFIAAFFACVFQCHGLQYWAIRQRASSSCINRPAFWTAVGALDILSDMVIHGLLGLTIIRSQMVSTQKQGATTIVGLYLARTASARIVFVSRSFDVDNFALVAEQTALPTFSQLILLMSLLCMGKLSKFLDLESYLSPAIGAASRKLGSKNSKNYYLPHNYGHYSANATGPEADKDPYRDSVEEVPLRARSGCMGSDGGSVEGNPDVSDAITVIRDVIVHSEHGRVDG